MASILITLNRCSKISQGSKLLYDESLQHVRTKHTYIHLSRHVCKYLYAVRKNLNVQCMYVYRIWARSGEARISVVMARGRRLTFVEVQVSVLDHSYDIIGAETQQRRLPGHVVRDGPHVLVASLRKREERQTVRESSLITVRPPSFTTNLV